MENSASAVVEEQHQTITSASIAAKSKKKSKNKKHSNGKNSISEHCKISTSEELLNNNGSVKATATVNDKSHTIGALNGLSSNFDEKLHLNDLKCNKLNGVMQENNRVKPKNTNSSSKLNTNQTSAAATENGYHIPSDASDGQTHANGNCLTTVDTKSNKLKTKLSNKYRNKEVAADHCLKNVDVADKNIAHMENGLNHCESTSLNKQNHENKNDAHVTESNCPLERLNAADVTIAGGVSPAATTQEATTNSIEQDHISTATKSNDTITTELTAVKDKNEAAVASDSSSQSTSAELTTAIPTAPALDLSNVHIEYKEYESELQMHDIMRLIQAELSEPYSIYTYRYFIYNWPKLCFLATHGNEYVGAIVCKLDMHMNVMRGYIAMLAVRKEYRKLRIGTTLVEKAIEAMLADNADEVVLETEMRNVPALRLYENLGFVRDKRLFRYYLNGVDALRLKLWFR